MSNSSERCELVLPDAAARRLSNQIDRACRGTFGAQVGLQTIVRSVARQLLRTGSPPNVVSRLLTECVLHHPGALGTDRGAVVNGKVNLSTLVALTEQSVAEVVRELPAA